MDERLTRLDDALLKRHHVLVRGDNPFQQRARLLQALWRERHSLPIGQHRGNPLGSRLAMPFAKESLANYLTPAIREVARTEILGPKAEDKLYGAPRIWEDLLSSQPLCFNLFAELQADLPLASRCLALLAPDKVNEVTAIDFEYSPGRGDLRFTGDRSAFDVFVEYRTTAGESGFLGIEVKYHEDLKNPVADHRSRYDEMADAMGVFRPERREALRRSPLQQIWRDHLLAGSLLAAMPGTYSHGGFVFLHPAENDSCVEAVTRYADCLTDTGTFTSWTLESVVGAFRMAGAGPLAESLSDRYLGFNRIV